MTGRRQLEDSYMTSTCRVGVRPLTVVRRLLPGPLSLWPARVLQQPTFETTVRLYIGAVSLVTQCDRVHNSGRRNSSRWPTYGGQKYRYLIDCVIDTWAMQLYPSRTAYVGRGICAKDLGCRSVGSAGHCATTVFVGRGGTRGEVIRTSLEHTRDSHFVIRS